MSGMMTKYKYDFAFYCESSQFIRIKNKKNLLGSCSCIFQAGNSGINLNFS
jgi:hypothetical protein